MIDWVDWVQIMANIIMPLSIMVAVSAYLYQKKRDKGIAVADQISFFNEKVIPKWDEIFKIVQSKKPDYVFSQVRLDNPSLTWVRENFFNESMKQANLLQEKNLNLFSEQTLLLNMLEELAIRIKYSGTTDHEALASLRYAFVQLVEFNASLLLLHREIFSGGLPYTDLLDLYLLWKDTVDRRSPKERLEEFSSKLTIN